MFLLMKSGYSFRTCLILPLFLQKGKREETGIKEMVKTFKPDLKEAGAFGQNECHRQFLLHRRALTPPLQGTMPYFLSQFFHAVPTTRAGPFRRRDQSDIFAALPVEIKHVKCYNTSEFMGGMVNYDETAFPFRVIRLFIIPAVRLRIAGAAPRGQSAGR